MPTPRTVLLVAPTFRSSFHTALYEYLNRRFETGELNLRGISDDPATQKANLIDILRRDGPTAVIAASVRPSPDVVAAYHLARIPLVLVDEEAPGVPSVTVDDFAGGRLAVSHLLSRGRRRLALVSGATGRPGGHSADQRLHGCMEALRAQRVTISPDAIIQVSNYSRDDGVAAMPKIMAARVDGIFCAAGDVCATGLLLAASKLSVSIPKDIAIVGYDDLAVAAIARPNLTTIRQPIEKMARAAYELALIEALATPETARRQVFDPELIVRQSS